MDKKLYRSRENKVIFGIFGGLGEYFDVDPALLRFGFIIIMFATGIFPLLLAYFVAYFVVPQKPKEEEEKKGDGEERNNNDN